MTTRLFTSGSAPQAALIRRGKSALVAVTAALENASTDPIAKRHLLWVLDALAGATTEATYPLIELLKSPVADLRAQSARALGEHNVPIAAEPLEPLLKDPEPSVRLQAVIALGRVGNAEAMPALLPLLADRDVYLAYSARQALRRIGDWPAAARGLDSPEARVPRRRLAGDGASVRRGGRRRSGAVRLVFRAARPGTHEGARVPGPGPPEGPSLGWTLVGHPAGGTKAAGKDDRLGRNASRDGDHR